MAHSPHGTPSFNINLIQYYPPIRSFLDDGALLFQRTSLTESQLNGTPFSDINQIQYLIFQSIHSWKMSHFCFSALLQHKANQINGTPSSADINLIYPISNCPICSFWCTFPTESQLDTQNKLVHSSTKIRFEMFSTRHN